MNSMFESSVNSEYSKTKYHFLYSSSVFESSVNSEYSKTNLLVIGCNQSV